MNGIQELGGSFKKQNRFLYTRAATSRGKAPSVLSASTSGCRVPAEPHAPPVSVRDELLAVTAPQPVPAVRCQELDSVILRGPFQLRTFYASMLPPQSWEAQPALRFEARAEQTSSEAERQENHDGSLTRKLCTAAACFGDAVLKLARTCAKRTAFVCRLLPRMAA